MVCRMKGKKREEEELAFQWLRQEFAREGRAREEKRKKKKGGGGEEHGGPLHALRKEGMKRKGGIRVDSLHLDS